MEKKDKLISAGKISSPHGVKGQVKIYSYLEYPEKFSEYKKFYFSNGEEVKLKYHFANKNFAVVSINAIADRDEVHKLNGKEIFIKRSQLKKLDQNQYYQQDLLGKKILLFGSGEEVGEVLSIQNFGAGDLIEMGYKGERQFVIFNTKNFPEIDTKSGLIYFSPPEVENP